MKRSPASVALFVALLIVAGVTRPIAAAPFDLAPRGSWTYDALAEFAVRGRVPGVSARSLHGDELRTRVELARMVARLAQSSAGDQDVSDKQRALLNQLLDEFQPEYRYLGIDDAALRTGLKTADEAAAREWYANLNGYVMGRVARRPSGDTGSDLVGRGTALVTVGRDVLIAGTLTNEQKLWSDRPRAFPLIDKLFVHVETKFGNWTLGREDRYWGPGYGGTMLLSDNAPTFPTLQFDKRFRLPLLGRIQFSEFVGTFNEPDGRKYVAARKIERMVGRRFGFSLQEAFKENTSYELPLGLLIPFYYYDNKIVVKHFNSPNEINYLADAQISYAAGEAVQTYVDFVLDDITGFLGQHDRVPRKIGYLVGLHLPRALGNDRTDVRIEYALTDGNDPGVPDKPEGGTYLHRDPGLAWFRDDLVMGHRVANNRRGPFVRVRQQFSPKVVGIVEWENERQWRATPVVGDRKRVMLYGAYDLTPAESVGLRVDRLRGAYGNDTLWQLQAAYSF